MASKINDNENLSNDGETDMNNDNEETSCVSSSSSGPKEQIENENRSTDQQSKTSEEESVTSSSGSNLDANKKPEANGKAHISHISVSFKSKPAACSIKVKSLYDADCLGMSDEYWLRSMPLHCCRL